LSEVGCSRMGCALGVARAEKREQERQEAEEKAREEANARVRKSSISLETETQQRYTILVKGYEEAIEALFNKLDIDGSGYLDAAEVSEVITLYTGTTFDSNQFFKWYETHGSKEVPTGKLSKQDFGWFIAEQATALPDPKRRMSGVITKIDESIEQVNRSRRPSRDAHDLGVPAARALSDVPPWSQAST